MRIGNFYITYDDPRSLYSEYINVFKNKIYHFTSDKNNPLIIDGGGHIGLSSLYFKSIYPQAKIEIFEPDGASLKMLNQNLTRNGLKNVIVHPIAITNSSGKASFDKARTDAGFISAVGNGIVETARLSNFIGANVDFLKLNIEGAEFQVLQDLEENNKLHFIKKMCIEWHSFRSKKQNLGGLLSILEQNNFKYLINHFDYRTNLVLKPPFQISPKTQYYLLVYAEQTSQSQ